MQHRARRMLFGFLIVITLTLTLRGGYFGHGSITNAQAKGGATPSQSWNATKNDEAQTDTGQTSVEQTSVEQTSVGQTSVEQTRTSQNAWSTIMDLDTKSAEIKALYDKVEPSINMGLFHIDNLATDQLAGIAAADFAWGDYDNDGDLDLLMAGSKETGRLGQDSVTQIYRNDRGGLTPLHDSLTGVTRGQVAWGDYDVDGDLDILLSGKTSDGQTITQIYQNHRGHFTNINAELTGLLDARVAWGDYDNDGDLDILIAGEDDHFYQRTLIYRNDSGWFVEQDGLLPFECKCDISWGDYDNDGLLDILASSIGPYEQMTNVFQNLGDGFRNIHANLAPVKGLGTTIWRDYDSDGDLDILITGLADNELPIAQLYRNDAGQYTEVNASLHPVWNSHASWGDYDNDGDLDLLLTGDMREMNPLTRLYRNDRTSFAEINIGLPNLHNGRVTWGDYDGDRDLDILYSGLSPDGTPLTQVWSNRGELSERPLAPKDLEAETLADSIYFNWSSGLDLETPSDGLMYSLAIHRVDIPSEPELQEVGLNEDTLDETTNNAGASLSLLLDKWPKSMLSSGIAKHGLSATLNLAPGNYAWAVQTIDSTSEHSGWSTIQQLEIMPDLVVSQSITPTIAQPGELVTITIQFSNAGNYPAKDIVLTSTLPSEISVQEIVVEPDAGVAISQTNKAIVAMVSWDTVPVDEDPMMNAVRVWSSSDLDTGRGGQIIMLGRVAETATIATYTQTLQSHSSYEPILFNNVATTSLAVEILPEKSWFNSVLLMLEHQKLLASLGFGVICLLLVAVTFIRF